MNVTGAGAGKAAAEQPRRCAQAHPTAHAQRYGGPLQWIAPLSDRSFDRMEEAVEEAADVGARAGYFHGRIVDGLYARRDAETLTRWVPQAQSVGLPAAVAAHDPVAHEWVNGLDLVAVHEVCFFSCGSLHSGQGHMFRLADCFAAIVRQVLGCQTEESKALLAAAQWR